MEGLPSKKNSGSNSCGLYEGVEYRDYWEGIVRGKIDKREKQIINDLLPISGHRLIEIGCGYGRLAECYIDRFQQVVMFDGSISLLRQAQENTSGRLIYIAGDLNRPPFRQASFDAVLMIRVLHHLEDPTTCISELHRILCDKGQLVFNYRNKRHAIRILKWLIRINIDSPFTKKPVEVSPLFIHHHPDHVHNILQKVGFSDFEYRGIGMLDRVASQNKIIGPLLIPSSTRMAPFLGKTKLAPWIFYRAVAIGNEALSIASSFDELLQCPSCKDRLLKESLGYRCCTCNRLYPVEDGIIDLRITE